jgi:hypothetical protein
MSFAGNTPRSTDAEGRADAAPASGATSAGGRTWSPGRYGRGGAGTGSSATTAGTTGRAGAEASPGTRNRGAASSPARRGATPGGATWRDSGAGEVDWARVGAFGVGIAIGALLGAGAALLYAPQSGRATRATLRRQARHLGYSAGDAWDDIGHELRGVARRGRRGLSRTITRSRWKAADALDG